MLTTINMLAAIGEATAPISVPPTLAALSAAVDRAIAQGRAA